MAYIDYEDDETCLPPGGDRRWFPYNRRNSFDRSMRLKMYRKGERYDGYDLQAKRQQSEEYKEKHKWYNRQYYQRKKERMSKLNQTA